MSRISCNVTKDLLSSYLDEVCSGESVELVEEHLKECASCRAFLTELQKQDMGKDAPRVAYLKKVRRFVDIQSLLGIFLPLLMLLGGFYGVNRADVRGEMFYYIEMPVMMLLCAYGLWGGRKTGRPAGLEWLAPAYGAVVFCALAVMRYMLSAWIVKYGESDWPDWLETIGPRMHAGCMAAAFASVILLAGLVFLARKKGKILPVSQNLAFLNLNLALSLDVVMYNMSDVEALQSFMVSNSMILLFEFLLVTVLLTVFRQAGLMKRVEIHDM
ncbi:MAG: zf-HC2 domain-containing protein [Butyrivibrio sp.]|nr:zf-HC2 domain-containing protein [Acetatifactor muris]MCM1560621.1 zf-HC2 domain-containing protein [Butyrivibrio sp.]